MTRRQVVTMLAGCFVAACVSGCKSPAAHPAPGYATVARSPGRDAARARDQNERAITLMQQGKWPEAEGVLKAALVADLTYGPAHNNLGKSFFEQGKFYLAAWEFQYAIKLMPSRPEPHNNLGLVLEETGKLDEAINEYDQALHLAPHSADVLGNAARARLRRGDRDEQVRALLKELVLCETRPDWLAWARERLTLLPSAPSSSPSSSSPAPPPPSESAPTSPSGPTQEEEP